MLGDRAFRRRCAEGHQVESIVAEAFRAEGLDVVEGPKSIRRHYDEVRTGRYHNEVDLVVAGHRIEVKGRRELAYTNDPRSYPYRICYVDEVAIFDRMDPRPLAYVFRAGRSGALLTVRTDWPERFEQRRTYKPIEEIWCDMYVVKKSFIRTFRSLVHYLQEHPA